MRLTLATLALIGLTTAASAFSAEALPQLTVPGGEPVPVPDTNVTLTLTEIEDQRCPAGVDCVWAGMIRVHLTVSTPVSKQEIVLCNQCNDATDLASAAGVTFGLVGLEPSKDELAKLGREAKLGDFRLTVSYRPEH